MKFLLNINLVQCGGYRQEIFRNFYFANASRINWSGERLKGDRLKVKQEGRRVCIYKCRLSVVANRNGIPL